jgi:hypothetical protein
MSGNLINSLAGLGRRLLADKKKAAVLAVLLVVLLIVIGRLFVSSSTLTPAAAASVSASVAAAPLPPPGPDPAKPIVRPSPEAAPVPPPTAPALGATARVSFSESQNGKTMRANAVRSVDTGDLPRVLERDLFNTNAWSKFPSAGGADAAAGSAGAAASGADSPGAVLQQLTDVLSRFQETRKGEAERVDSDLAALQIQSTMTGPTPMAYISGRLVREGDVISGFTVVHIGDRRVSVRKLGLTRELHMP